ncbi:hypothetical protein N657DRAFT_649161 [Parathielavia appendiculata]|uniref:Uncharacterized protein n=1 Tax=Parathielavia appendiculata TaxID=2587402 RepID=A0AAN6TTD1_9PEZI|nr:hypothetical protein N657DRAFT_649161 [Parathielavia appendiculata]
MEQSRVCRRNANQGECDRSYTSTVQPSHVWPAFEGYSLADVSVLSVIAMPSTTLDFENGSHCPIRPQDGSSMGPQDRRRGAAINISSTDYCANELAEWVTGNPVPTNRSPGGQPVITMETDEFSQRFIAALGKIEEDA